MIKIWQLIFEAGVEKKFSKLPKNIQSQILDYFDDRVLVIPEPMILASPLTGDMSGLHRFRIGDYRVICNLDKGKLIIVAVAVGHRKDIYKKVRH